MTLKGVCRHPKEAVFRIYLKVYNLGNTQKEVYRKNIFGYLAIKLDQSDNGK